MWKSVGLGVFLLPMLVTLVLADSYEEEFVDNRHRWAIEDYDEVTTSIENGGYNIRMRDDENYFHYTRETLLDDEFDYSVSARIGILSGSASASAGIVVAASGYSTYYGLHVSPAGRVTMDGSKDGEYFSVVSRVEIAGVHEAGYFNDLRLEVANGNITGYVNGNRVASTTYTSTGHSNIGFEVYHKVDIKVEWLRISDPVANRTAQEFFDSKFRKNVGRVINTEGTESCPVITSDGSRLYFNRTAKGDENGDLWYADIEPDGTFSTPVRIPAPINNADDNWAVSVAQDNNSLVLAGEYRDGETFSGFSVTNRTSSGWSYPSDLTIENHYSNATQTSYFMSADREILVLGVERNDTRGKDDLYVSFKLPDGTYSEPVSLGDDINGPEDEMTPFLAPDNTTLYFSSKSYEDSYGSADVYVTRRLDNTWKSWSEPENLGPRVNSAAWDAYFVTSADGKNAYMVSFENSFGESDILRVDLSEKDRPSPLLLVRGTVVDSETKEPLAASVVYTDKATGQRMGAAISDPTTGEYQVILNRGREYVVAAQRNDYFPVTESFDVRELGVTKVLQQDLELAPVKVGTLFRLNNVYFETGKSQLKPESKAELDELVRLLSASAVSIRIGGHTDDVGSDADNLKLSQDRASSVRDYLIEHGVPAARLQAQGFGESRPARPNTTDENRAFNRRVECEFIE